MNPPPNFNRMAGAYRWMEAATFGPWLWWCRCAFLRQAALPRGNALVLGDGDGRFAARLLRAAPALEIDAVDASEAMLRRLVRRAGPDAFRLRACCADARAFHPPRPPYSLIVSHFFLDCLSTAEIESLAATVRRAAAPSALWLVSEFAVPRGCFGRFLARPLVWSLYWAFGRLTGLAQRRLPDHHSALRHAGFTIQLRRKWLGGLLVSELWQANGLQPSP